MPKPDLPVSDLICCVFQPFDGGKEFDTRYDETIAPSLVLAGLEPYRVDRDASATFLLESLHAAIDKSAICLADITGNNPNVMYELGYALARGKNVVIIRKEEASAFPFDIRHLRIISYSTGTKASIAQLEHSITTAANALLSAAPVREPTVRHGASVPDMVDHDLTALQVLLTETPLSASSVSVDILRTRLLERGFSDYHASMAISSLEHMKLLSVQWVEESQFEDGCYLLRLSEQGRDMALRIRLQHPDPPPRRTKKVPASKNTYPDDNIPF